MDTPHDTPAGKTAAQASAPCDPAAPRVISHAEMDAAYDSGHAVPLGQGIAWLARYRDAWWVAYERGWLRVTDDVMAADLDQAAAHLTAADAATVRDISIRGGLGLHPGQDASAMPAELLGGSASDYRASAQPRWLCGWVCFSCFHVMCYLKYKRSGCRCLPRSGQREHSHPAPFTHQRQNHE